MGCIAILPKKHLAEQLEVLAPIASELGNRMPMWGYQISQIMMEHRTFSRNAALNPDRFLSKRTEFLPEPAQHLRPRVADETATGTIRRFAARPGRRKRLAGAHMRQFLLP